MAVIIAPSRMEPARIEDPAQSLCELARACLVAAAQLERHGRSLPAWAREAEDLRRVISEVDAWHSHALEGIFLGRSGGEAPSVLSHGRLWRAVVAGDHRDPADPDQLRAWHGALFDGCSTHSAGTWRPTDVVVGDHVPPPHDSIPAFMAHFHRRFRNDWLKGEVTRVLAVAAAHHRLLWIHPFLDGNGRLGRLHSVALCQTAGLGGGGLWSLSRALWRGLDAGEGEGAGYRRMMAVADRPRQGDRDGRGNLSLSALETFCRWFLTVCLSELKAAGALVSHEGLDAKAWRERISLG